MFSSDRKFVGVVCFDYAEYFESTDGTAIPVGTTVVLVNEKVRAATSGEQPLGVVRPGSDGTSVVGVQLI